MLNNYSNLQSMNIEIINIIIYSNILIKFTFDNEYLK